MTVKYANVQECVYFVLQQESSAAAVTFGFFAAANKQLLGRRLLIWSLKCLHFCLDVEISSRSAVALDSST